MSDEIEPEIKAIIEQQEASLQRIAMRIIEMPPAVRDAAMEASKRRFEEAALVVFSDPKRAADWADLLVRCLRSLVSDMEAGGGRGGRA
jgi:hypothetical protein